MSDQIGPKLMDESRYPNPRSRARPAKKQRKQRPSHSCQECRRLKMKCDRRVSQGPCSNCVRRNRADICFGVSSGAHTPRSQSNPPASDQGHSGQGQQILDLQDPPLRPLQPATQPSPYDQHDHGTRGGTDKLGQLALLARAVEPLAASRRGTQSQSPTALPGATQEAPEQQQPPGGGNAPDLLNGTAAGAEAGSIGHRATQHAVDHGSDQNGSYGTLMFGKGGRSKYLGPTAGSEWLKDSETREMSATPAATRAPSPEAASPSTEAHHRHHHSHSSSTVPIAFPLHASPARISTRDLLSRLPSREETWILVESYYRYCAWHHDVAPKPRFEETFDRVFKLVDGQPPSPPVNAQEIALLYMIMAQGTLYNIEMTFNDPSAEEWVRLAERALVKGDFLATNTIAGIQALHLLSHYHLELDKGRRGDNAWPLFGLMMRLIQAMGMHRDGTRWSLPEDVVEERRKVFWECHAGDIFQAHCFSRPCAINPEHCDTSFPAEPLNLKGEKSYSRLRFELSLLSSEILNIAMKVRKPEYSAVLELDRRLCQFEQSVPFYLRCRAAFLSMPSRYPQLDAVIEASPEPSPRSMTTSFQQMNLALNICETIINLHRPYYAKALYEDIDDPLKSEYAPSYLTVIERCSVRRARPPTPRVPFPIN
ncbi:hypothetical protein VTK73DRAFT_5467 [Phialemonium thermophilum]|uniref:Zn(2)-C6 fungal-type domain-containing protein n=1 Tax=Phialemonium thermophilum TaxID=223376 RepID=A0ABR3WNC4_9PEZI